MSDPNRSRERELALMFLGFYSKLDPAVLEQLADGGRKIARCNCDWEGCLGWAMYWPDEDPEGEVFPIIVLNGR